MPKSQQSGLEVFQRFLDAAVFSGTIFTLYKEPMFALCDATSELYYGLKLLPIWSEPALALYHAQNEWDGYELAEIPLPYFLETLLPELSQDGIVLGIDFNLNLVGYELEPSSLYQAFSNRINDATSD